MKRSRLPLTALRTFEAAGRLQSFTLAAGELHISQAAVSRQVRELELLLGQALFARGHRSVSLTASGASLLATLTPAFDSIALSLDLLTRGREPRSVSVSAEPSFASAWLVRNLADFTRSEPDVDVTLDADPAIREFRKDGAVLAIRHSLDRSSWPRVECRHLLDVSVVPVAAPALLDSLGAIKDPADLLRLPIIHEDSRNLWQKWFSLAGVSAPIERGTVYADGGLVLQAVLQGEGIALLDELFVRDHLAAGRLRVPFVLPIPHGAYWLVAKSFPALSEEAGRFVRWLEARLRGPAGNRS